MNGNEEQTAKYSLEKIVEYYNSENYGRAFAHFILLLELGPYFHTFQYLTDLEEFFIHITLKWCTILSKDQADDKVVFCYTQALRYFPNNLELLNSFGAHYNRCNETSLAIKYFEKAHETDPNHLKTEKNLQSIYAGKVPQWHFRMLNDKVRNTIYKNAINSVLKDYNNLKDLRLVDIGTGSGLLSLFAQEFSRKHRKSKQQIQIVAIEACEIMSQVAQNVFRSNNAPEINLVQKLSTEISNEKNFNLLITEIFDCCLFGEGVLTTLIHAHSELLTKSSVVLPHCAKLYIFGIESDQICSTFRARAQSSIKLPKCVKKKHEEPYDALSINLFRYKQVTNVCEVGTINFNDVNQLKKIFNDDTAFNAVILNIVEAGTCQAFVIYFELFLDKEGIYKISTNPHETSEICTCWEQGIVFPKHEINVQQNDKLILHINAVNDKLTVNVHTVISHKTTNISREISILNECNCRFVSSSTISHLNWKELHAYYQNIIENVLRNQQKNQLRVLEVSTTPIFTIAFNKFIKNQHKNVESVIVTPHKQLSFVQEVLQLNNIKKHSYKLISSENFEMYLACDDFSVENQEDYDEFLEIGKFDYIIFNPVLENGLLNEKFFKNIDSYKKLGTFIPGKLTLCFELVESNYFEICTQASDENSFQYNIGKHINRYSVLEMRSLNGDFQRKVLSNIVRVDLNYSEQLFEEVIKVPMCKDGVLNGFLYWFEFNHLDFVISSRDSSYNMAAFVVNKMQKINVRKEMKIDVKVTHDCGLLKISLN